MNDADRIKLEAELSRNLKGKMWGAIATVGAGWCMYLLKVLAGIDVIAFLHPDEKKLFSTTPLYLILAIVFTFAAIPWVMVKKGKARRLSTRGIVVDGTVVAHTIVSKHGMVPATIAYAVDGKEYKFRTDRYAMTCVVGATVRIVYDPKDPTCREVL